jgi:hypothetical protein
LLISCRIFLCSLTNVLLHYSHDWSNWSSPSFPISTSDFYLCFECWACTALLGCFHVFYMGEMWPHEGMCIDTGSMGGKSSVCPEYGDNRFLWNVCTYLPDRVVSRPTSPWSYCMP